MFKMVKMTLHSDALSDVIIYVQGFINFCLEVGLVPVKINVVPYSENQRCPHSEGEISMVWGNGVNNL